MIEIVAYAVSIMYTPGPVNLLTLNAGLNGEITAARRFCMGVACAMLLLFLIFGYSGAWLIDSSFQLLISSAGSVFIVYLGYKIARSDVQLRESEKSTQTEERESKLNFRSGMIMQMLNPKSFIAILPIATVQFPAAEITGTSIFFWSLFLSFLAFGAPGGYLLIGARLGHWLSNQLYFRVLNLSMALLMFYVAADIAYNYVYLKWE